MKRLILAAVGGVLVPVVYTLAVATVAELLFGGAGTTMHVNGRAVPHFVLAPTMIPLYINEFLSANNFFGLWFYLDNMWFRATFFILFNFILYSILTYAFLKKIGWPRTAARDWVRS